MNVFVFIYIHLFRLVEKEREKGILHIFIYLFIYFRTTQKKPALLDVRNFRSLDYTTFNNSHPTKVIIHGFGGGRNLAPSTDLRNGELFSIIHI